MTSFTRRILFNNQSVKILNGFYTSQTFKKSFRQFHLMNNQYSIGSRLSNVISLQNSCSGLNHCERVNTSVRYKSNKRNRRDKEQDNENDEEDDDDDSSDINEFKDGDKSDRNLAQLKIQTLRLDTVIKAGLGISKR